MKKNSDNKDNELTLDLIERARAGDEEAPSFILKYYNRIILAKATYTVYDKEGVAHRKIDEDMKAQLQMTLVYAIKNWRELI